MTDLLFMFIERLDCRLSSCWMMLFHICSTSGGFQYEFSHMEIHVPGEHAFAGKVNSKCEAGTDCPYDCEFHLVHTKSSSSGIELGQTLDDAKEAPASDASDSEKPPPKPKDAARTTDSALGALVQEEKNARAQGKLESTKEQPIDASILILAIPGQVGTRPNTVFQQLIEGMPEKDSEKHLLGEFNFADILPENPTYYRYSGSLTKPPCTEVMITLCGLLCALKPRGLHYALMMKTS